jgi:hypothetical protein
MADISSSDRIPQQDRVKPAFFCRTMSRHPIAWRITIVAIVSIVILGAAYVSFSKWAIAHDPLDLIDQKRGRVVDLDLAVRFDVRMRARAGLATMPVAVLNHGNTVKYTEYSFIANMLAARGYMVVSIQHDLPSDGELVTREGSLFVGRLKVYEKGEANILFAMQELKKIEPNADYRDLLMIGHSNGGDIAMYFAQQHPDMVRKVVTLDNLRVPFITSGPKVMSFRSRDWKPDPGVVPDDETAKKAGIRIVRTDAQHTDMSDRGPEDVKRRIQSTLDQFLGEPDTSNLGPVKDRDWTSDVRARGP